jgi:hypothetical protein
MVSIRTILLLVATFIIGFFGGASMEAYLENRDEEER